MAPLIALAFALLITAPRDTLVVGLLADPVSLHPHRATDLVSAAVVSAACETLVQFRAGGTRAEPGRLKRPTCSCSFGRAPTWRSCT